MLKELRPVATYPIYPPYHQGEYLEEYFSKNYKQEYSKRQYIDIFWTNLYCNGNYSINIQSELNKLPQQEKFFTVCQHDDGPKENLPKDTLIFSAGGNRTHGKIIPIPLICSRIPDYLLYKVEKKIFFASFIGSLTHYLREVMVNCISGNNDYFINMSIWTNNVPIDDFKKFANITSLSKFSLCPRGYGPTSFRLYECFQLGSVPVYISDYHYLPWQDELNLEEFCVLIKPEQLCDLDKILKGIDDERYNKMLITGIETYNKYFTLDAMVNNIIKRIS
jgi:hypothetical protein